MGWNRLRSNGSTGGRSVPCEADQLELYQPVTVGVSPIILWFWMDGWDTCVSRRGFTGRYKFDHSGRGTGSLPQRSGGVRRGADAALRGAERRRPHARAVFSLEGDGPYALDIPASPVFLVSVLVEDTVPHRTCQHRGYHLL